MVLRASSGAPPPDNALRFITHMMKRNVPLGGYRLSTR
ncbi:hypothetical protein KPATCC21470_7394 [Kitasatospora purpeofusca]